MIRSRLPPEADKAGEPATGMAVAGSVLVQETAIGVAEAEIVPFFLVLERFMRLEVMEGHRVMAAATVICHRHLLR